jgi:hypothetical protein
MSGMNLTNKVGLQEEKEAGIALLSRNELESAKILSS